MTKAGIYKINNGEMVLKRHAFLIEAPAPIFFLLLLLFGVADFESDDVIDNNREKNKFVIFLPRHKYAKEDK